MSDRPSPALFRKFVFLAVSVAFLAGPRAIAAPAGTVYYKGRPVHPTRLIARVAPGSATTAHLAAHSSAGLHALRGCDLVPGLVVFEFDEASAGAQVAQSQASALATDPAAAAREQAARLEGRLRALRASGLYTYVEPDYILSREATPSDTAFTDGTLWGLRNQGQNGGFSGIDIDVVRAWDITTGSPSVVVAVVDSGIRTTHADLASRLWVNPGEIAGNGLDDDANGYVDDIHGIDTITGSGNPADDDGHGTHVAGTIGAAANNGAPMVGVAWNVRLMACRFLSAAGAGATSDAIEGINYAVARGARIINCSWGSDGQSVALREAIAAAGDHGVLVVTAAGNSSRDTDAQPHYPSGFPLDNIIAVAAMNRVGSLTSTTNRGRTSVDLAAPGDTIYSCSNTGDTSYAVYSGTSMAAPHVSGVAALVLSHMPGLSVSALRDRVLRTTRASASLSLDTATGGRVSAYQALTATPDNQLEIELAPTPGTYLAAGRTATFRARVTDLLAVADATVSGTIDGATPVTFRDDGVAPDQAAGDGIHTASVIVSSSVTQLTLAATASAPGRTSASATAAYLVEPPPANDDFANRIAFASATYLDSRINRHATREPGEPAHAGNSGGASLWWTWTSPGSGTATFRTTGANFDTTLAIYTGASLGALTEIASNDDLATGNTESQVNISVTAGTTYQIAVDGFDGVTGHFTLELTSVIAAPNDAFANRATLSGAAATASAFTHNASREAGEPNIRPDTSPGGSVWYTWTAPATGTATFIAQSASTGLYVDAFLGGSLATLVHAPGRRDDAQGTPQARTTIATVAGATYQIAVTNAYAYSGTTFTLTLSTAAGPANDHFASRAPLASGTTSATNVGASREPGEPLLSSSASGATVWWSWTAPSSGTAVISTQGTPFSNIVGVYTGSSLDTLTLVAANAGGLDYFRTSRVAFRTTAGTTYAIAVDGTGWSLSTGTIQLALELVATPANDHFAERATLAGTSGAAPGDLRGATIEAGEPPAIAGAGARAVSTCWWTWTAPSSGTLTVRSSSSSPTLLGVFTGNSLDALVRVHNSAAQVSAATTTITHVDAGTTCQIVVDATITYDPSFTLEYTLVAAPANDMFAARATLPGASGSVAGTTVDATGEFSEPTWANLTRRASVWYRWTAPASGLLDLQLSYAAERRHVVAVFTGAAVDGLTQVPSIFGSLGSFGQHVVPVTAGVTYQIEVETDTGWPGSFTLGYASVTPPANDAFAQRAPLAGASVSVVGDNYGATAEPGEPAHAASLPQAAASVWWTWTAPSSGTLIASTAAGSNTQPHVAIHTGNAVGALTRAGFSEVFNREGIYSHAIAQVTAGTTYAIAVASRDTLGTFTLALQLAASPANDAFAAATPLPGISGNVTGSNAGASLETGETAPAVNPSAAFTTIWWDWTAPASGTMTLDTAGTPFDTVLRVSTGASVSGLTWVAANDDAAAGVTTSRVQFNAIAGTTYRIVVAGKLGASGPISLAYTLADPPANDTFAGRVALTGSSGSIQANNLGASREPGEPAHTIGWFAAINSVWYEWTAPATGTADFACTGAAHLLEAYVGDAVGTLSRATATTSPAVARTIRFHAVSGQRYAIAVASDDSSGTRVGSLFLLTYTLHGAPPNDMFADRTALAGAYHGINVSLDFATRETAEAAHVDPYATRTLWWSWTAPASGRALFHSNTSYAHRLTVFTGATLATLVERGSNQARINTVALDVTSGTTYQVCLSNGSASVVSGPIDLAIGMVTTPANDAFADRLTLTGIDVMTTGSNFGATIETAEPAHGVARNTSVWWTWTASADGLVSVTTAGSTFDTALAIHTGTALGSLSSVFDNNDAITGVLTSALTFYAVAGTTYHIAVDGVSGAMGSISLALRMGGAPINGGAVVRSQPSTPAGSRLTLTAGPAGDGPFTYQWFFNFNPIAGATGASYTIPSVQGFNAGRYTVQIANAFGTTTQETQVSAPRPDTTGSRLVNISTRARCLGGDGAIVPGFVIAGTGSKLLLIRAVGPTLAPFGVTDPLADPRLALKRLQDAAWVDESGNDDWAADASLISAIETTSAVVGAFTLPRNSADAVVLESCVPGQYTAITTGRDSAATGVALLEIYDADPAPTTRFVNLSCRTHVGTGNDVVVPGFVIADAPMTLLIRAIGPSLAPFGVAGHLPNPRFTLHDSDGAIITTDDWGTVLNYHETTTTAAQVGAFALPWDSADAALVVTLPPGRYTVVTSGASTDRNGYPVSTTGVALVEIYVAP